MHSVMGIFLVLSFCSAALTVAGVEPEFTGTDISQDGLRFLNAVNKGLGFYWDLPYITSLTDDNFDQAVLNSTNSWVIEFYQSWCGYCLRYTTHFKRFAKDLHGWQPVLKVAAVDCNFNSALCRRFGVIHVPSVKYIPPQFNNDYSDVVELDQRKGDEPRKTPAQLRADIVQVLMKRQDLPMLKPYLGGLKDMWASLPIGFDWALVVTGCSNVPTIGQELLLDYWHTNPVIVVPVPCGEAQLITDLGITPQKFASLYVLRRDETLAVNQLLNEHPADRAEALRMVKAFFTSYGVKVPEPVDPNSIPDLNITKQELIDYAKTHSNGTIPFPHSGIVYQVDIEAAIDHSITHELAQAQEIEGEAFRALVSYLELMKKYFPTVKNGKLLFKCLFDNIAGKGTTSGLEVLATYNQCVSKNKPVYLDPNNGWLGCRGTLPMFRGFPCSMWMMFHTLQAQAYKRQDPNPKVVLDVMIGYIKHFFACQDCAEHFLGVAKTMPPLKDIGEAVLWLNYAHNLANKRLHGDQTEDPKYPKVQFPPTDLCSECHNSDGTFNDDEVLKFLVNMYTNVDQHVWADYKPQILPSAEKFIRSEFIINEEEDEFIPVTTRHLWAAHSLEITLAASLAGLALALIILICLMFCRTYSLRPRLFNVQS